MKTRAEIINAFRAKYEALKPSFPQIGPFESHRMSRLGDIRVCDLGNDGKAAFVMDGDGRVVEVHGGIYDVWKGNGGINGGLGLPVTDQSDYLGPDARPGDRFSKFENGVIVWRADTWKTEIRMFNRCHEIVRQFGVGINLGNSFDAPDGETSWGNPPVSRKLLQFYRKEGFRTIRVPATWHRHLDAAGVVDPAFMNRVREVIGWCLDEGLTTILNLHHEDGWLSPAFDESALRRFTGLWTQIAKRFADCGERLVFEAFNEIRNGDDWQGTDEAFDAVNRLAAKFVETIRASGGNNIDRYLLIPTYAASTGETACRSWARVANDERLIATVHCYSPHEFTHQPNGPKEYDSNWCKPALEAIFDCLKRTFLDCGIPAVIGEAGVKQVNGCPSEEGRIAWAQGIASLSLQHGVPVIVWDDGGDFQLADRHLACWSHPRLVGAYVHSSCTSRALRDFAMKNSTKPIIPDYKPGVRVRGVNLGGWLVLERWMKESLFAGVNGKDETCFCVQLGREEASRRLREHWDTWITEADFAWIADHGFNAVRIPVGHWIFGSASGYPYHDRYGADPHPYVDGGIERLDRAFDWAEKHGLMVLVDLHCAPGCQNGFDNGGLEGVCDWYKKPEYVDFTVLTLERLAERYGKRKALWGIETLNEPNWEVPDWVLVDFNWRAYQAIRKHCPPENGAVVIHDGFRDSRIKDVFGGKMPHPEFQNVVLDAHRYQCFGPGPGQPDLRTFDHAANIRHAEGHIADEMRGLNEAVYWTICGEWSLATGGRRTDAERQAFFDAQTMAFENCQGFFFWSYKLENGDPSWSLRTAVERGLPLRQEKA